ncbi:cytochrome c oxidase subunit 3 [bacterium]|nr:cytochrome c oxidase subunit 3 [bacterium]
MATGIPHIKLLWWSYLASDCMLFGGLIAGYLIYKGRSHAPPYPMDVFDFQTTTISTFILLASSLTMVLQLAAIQKGNLARFRLFNILTILAGLIFLGFQVFEFRAFYDEGLTLQTNLFGASFYLLTGVHGMHVAVGVLWMVALLIYSYWGGVTKKRAIDVEVAGLYWHFVDVVWIVIFSVVYLMEYTA